MPRARGLGAFRCGGAGGFHEAGQFRLWHPAAQILDALEGPVALTECAGSASHCGIERTCRVGHAWQRVNLAIRRSLQEITLLELAGLSSAVNRYVALDRGIPVALGALSGRGAKREPL